MARPDRTLSWPNSDFYARNVDFVLKSLPNLRRAGFLQEELNGLLKIVLALLDGIALACNVQLRAQCNVAVPFALYYGREARLCRHYFLQRFCRAYTRPVVAAGCNSTISARSNSRSLVSGIRPSGVQPRAS